jgi:hypothetical protein
LIAALEFTICNGADVQFPSGTTNLLEKDIFGRRIEPQYCGMRKYVQKKIASGKLDEESDLSEVLDSLELVELNMEAEESGVEPAVEIKTVRDFLWLCRAMDFQRQREESRSN